MGQGDHQPDPRLRRSVHKHGKGISDRAYPPGCGGVSPGEFRGRAGRFHGERRDHPAGAGLLRDPDPFGEDHGGDHGRHPDVEGSRQARHGRGQYRGGSRHGKGDPGGQRPLLQPERRGGAYRDAAAGTVQADGADGSADPGRPVQRAQHLQDHRAEGRHGGHHRHGQDLPAGGEEALRL